VSRLAPEAQHIFIEFAVPSDKPEES